MDHDWEPPTRPKNKRLHGYRYKKSSPTRKDEIAMDCDGGSTTTETQMNNVPQVEILDHNVRCPEKRARLDSQGSRPVYHSLANGCGSSNPCQPLESRHMFRVERFQRQKFQEVQAIKKAFKDGGYSPVPDTDDVIYLTTELKRHQYCRTHGIVYDPGNLSPNSTTTRAPKRQTTSLENRIPEKIRVLHNNKGH